MKEQLQPARRSGLDDRARPPAEPARQWRYSAANSRQGFVDARLAHGLVTSSRVLSGLVLLTGALVLSGWFFDVAALEAARPSFGLMKPNTAFGFVIVGAAFALSRAGADATRRRLARLLGGLAALFGALTLGQDILGTDLGIDQALVAVGSSEPRAARMSPATAALFVLTGSAIVLGDVRPAVWRCSLSEWLAFAIGSTAFAIVLGYLYGVESLYEIQPFATVAFHTGAGFLLAAGALLLRREDGGLVRLLSGRDPGGVAARRLLPAALVVPVGVGWLRLQGERAGLYGFEFGLALFAASNCLCFSVLTLWAARLLRASDGARWQTEQALRDSEENLSITLNSIGDGVIATDTSGRVTRMNPVAQALTGWSLAQAEGKPLAEVFRIVNETTQQIVESPVDRVLRDGQVVELANHTVLVARDGRQRSIADSGAPIRDAHGNMHGVVLVFRDQTRQRHTEDALELTRARFARLAEAGLIGIVTADFPGSIVEINDVFLRIIGHSREDVLSGRVRPADFNLPEWRDADNHAIEELRSRGVTAPYEKEYLRKDGTRIPVLIGAVLEAGTCVAFALDLSERRRAQEVRVKLGEEAAGRLRAEAALKSTETQLQQAQKMEAVGRLAGGVAHDFNNLLSVILGYAQLLLAGVRASDPMHSDLKQILYAGQRGSSLTRQLLAFSRQQVLAPKLLDLNVTFGDMRDLLRRLIGEDIELEIRGGRIGKVHVDPGQMEQVLMNLVVNARDAMPRGGRIAIETASVQLDAEYASGHVGVESGPHVMFSVSDTGVGMDDSTRARIFEPFFTTKGDRGTGLGLATVFGIVKQSGGHISVQSEVGHGTTFKVFLKQAHAATDALGAASSLVPVASQRGSETVLLVEDDAQVRTLTHKVLTRSGYRVLAASSGDEALVTASQHAGSIDLLFTDVIMPRMSGRELAERMLIERPDLKVLFMSGYTDDAVVHHGVRSSEMAFIQKPIMFAELLAKVREVLDQPVGRSSVPELRSSSEHARLR